MSNNVDGQTAWRLAPATGRASETTYRGLLFVYLFLFCSDLGQKQTAQESDPDSQA